MFEVRGDEGDERVKTRVILAQCSAMLSESVALHTAKQFLRRWMEDGLSPAARPPRPPLLCI